MTVLSDADLDRCILVALRSRFEADDMPSTIQRLYEVMVEARVLPYDREAMRYPSHPLRLRIKDSIDRLRNDRELMFMGLDPLPERL